MKTSVRLLLLLLVGTVMCREVRGDASDNSVAVSLNTFGILKINSATTNTMVAVPWTWYSKKEEDAGLVKAYKLVKTTNLTVGDMLYAYVSDGHYAAWRATATATEGILSWEPVATVWRDGGQNGTVVIQCDDKEKGEVTVLPRAAGVWLCRQNPLDGEGNIRPFWIYAQSVDLPVTTTIAPISDVQDGKSRAERSTMLGNPYAQPVSINDLVFTGTVGANDTIIVPNGTAASKYLQYRDTGTPRRPTGTKKWIWVETKMVEGRLTEEKHDDVAVEPGLAFWYVRRGEGELSISWPRPSSTPVNAGN